MEHMTYKEASEILNKNEGTVQHAIGRGVFTRLPSPAQTKYLIKGQVMLFVGKSQLSLRSLSKDELALWKQYELEAERGVSNVTPQIITMPQRQISEGEIIEGIVKMAMDVANTAMKYVAKKDDEISPFQLQAVE